MCIPVFGMGMARAWHWAWISYFQWYCRFSPESGCLETADQAYLPGVGVNCDQQGSSPRARLLHCTPELLTPAISPNVGNSGAQFLLVGICVRANPFNQLHSSWNCSFEAVHLPTLCVPSFKNNTWNSKLGGSFDNTLSTNPKENSTNSSDLFWVSAQYSLQVLNSMYCF